MATFRTFVELKDTKPPARVQASPNAPWLLPGLAPPPRSRGPGGARGQLPSDGACGGPPTARVMHHGIGVATDYLSHAHGNRRHETTSVNLDKPEYAGYRPIRLLPRARELARAGRCQRALALRWRGWQPTDRTREEPRHRSRNRRLFAHSWSRKTQNHQRESKATPSAPRLPPDFRFGSSRTHSSTRGSGGARGHMTSDGGWRLTDRTRGEPRHRRCNWRFESNQARVHRGYRPIWLLPRAHEGTGDAEKRQKIQKRRWALQGRGHEMSGDPPTVALE